MNCYISTLSDKVEAVKLLLDFHKKSEMPFPTSAAWALDLFKTCVQSPDRVAISKEGGILLGAVGKSLLGPILQSHEIAWWVDPEHRGGSVDMLKMYEDWAIEKGAKLIEVKSLNIFKDVDRLYERMGYSPIETSWVKVV